MKRMEILAPSGSTESVYAAVRSGANAVYLGLDRFSARANAQNFTIEELKEVTDYCHERDVLVYLTANTLVFDGELCDAVELVKEAAKAGIDAVIVQDIGFAMLIKEAIPDLSLHGSTQMSVHTPFGAKALYEMGFKRVVVSRELSKDEIQQIVSSCPVEIEVFVHGALCMCVSGQCYFSAMLGSRSGNRGLCAQPCRLPFKVKNGNGYALSLKDNSLVEYLGELEKIGVCSAKIEGRMKRPEYVSAAVSACRESLYNGFVSDKTATLLDSVFSRTGFTDGYYTAKRGYDMFGYRQKEDVVKSDSQTLKEIRAIYNKERQSVAINCDIKIKEGKNVQLSVTDKNHTVTLESEQIPQKAINVAIDEEKCVAQLKKTGNTPYYVQEISCDIDDGLSVPVSLINSLRRDALSKLSLLRSQSKQYTYTAFDVKDFLLKNKRKTENRQALKSRIRLTDCTYRNELVDFELVFVPIFSDDSEILNLINKGVNVGCEIPRGMFGIESRIEKRLEQIKEMKITSVLASNIGAVYLAKNMGFDVHGGFGLNLVNTASLMWAQNYGLCDVELSFELTQEQIKSLGADIKRGIISYGYLPLMLTRNCPQKSGNISCKDCDNAGKVVDRLQKDFFLKCECGCVEVLNSVPLIMLEKIYNFVNIDFQVFRETVENSVENVENIRNLMRKHLENKNFTYGLYYRGVK